MIEWTEDVPAGTPLWWNADHTEVMVRDRDGTFRTVGRVVADPEPDAVVETSAVDRGGRGG